jgi:hypothetical protein
MRQLLGSGQTIERECAACGSTFAVQKRLAQRRSRSAACERRTATQGGSGERKGEGRTPVTLHPASESISSYRAKSRVSASVLAHMASRPDETTGAATHASRISSARGSGRACLCRGPQLWRGYAANRRGRICACRLWFELG